MPELRRDPLSGRWVSYAPERAKRPAPLRGESAVVDDPERCPFCPGKEHMTTPAVLAVLREGSRLVLRRESGEERIKGWLVRIFSNLYPAFSVEDSIRIGDEATPTRGHHEVLVETPQHDGDLWKLDVEQVYAALFAARERLRELESEEEVKVVAFTKNHGPFSGGSLRHPHMHLIALPITPPLLQAEASALKKPNCALCAEIEEDSRTVLDSDGFRVSCAWAGKEPYELRVIPKKHEENFTGIDDKELRELAHVFSKTFKALHIVLGEFSFNIALHTKPKNVEDFHWHVEIIPRLLIPTSIDVGMEVYVSTLLPEEAAEKLKKAL